MNYEQFVELTARSLAAFHRPSRPEFEFETFQDTYLSEARAVLAALWGAGWLVVPKETVHPDYEAAARVFKEAGYVNKGIRVLLDRAVDEALRKADSGGLG